MSVDVREMLSRQRRRAVGAILGYAESQPWYEGMTRQQQVAYREKVLASMSAYHDVVLDIVATLDGSGGIYNDRALELLEAIHGMVSPHRERPLPRAVGDGG